MFLPRWPWALVILALLGAGSVSGCNTVEGAGRDIESGGEFIQDGAQEVEEEIAD